MFIDDGIRLVDFTISKFAHTENSPTTKLTAEIGEIGTLKMFALSNRSISGFYAFGNIVYQEDPFFSEKSAISFLSRNLFVLLHPQNQ